VNLLDSLLDAIVRLDGDALVMHVGEKPYVVTTSEATNQFRGPLAWGQVELSTRVLTTDAVTGMLGQLLPLDQRSALDEFGATDYGVSAAAHPEERFTIVAARGGDDIWIEMRRHPKPPAVAAAAPAPEQPAEFVESRAMEQPAEEPITLPAAPPTGAPQAAEAFTAVENTPVANVEPAAVPVAAQEEVEGPARADDVLGLDPDAEIEEPFSIEVSPDWLEEPALAADLDAHAFNLDADVEAGILAATQEWGDDVMTEGELGELLRATAAEVITGETLGISAVDLDTERPLAVAEPELEAPAPAAEGFVEAPAVDEPAAATQAQPAAASTPEPTAAERPADLPASVEVAGEVSPENGVSRETRELPALVEYQLERDRAAGAFEVAAGQEDSIPSTEGVWPVSEDVNLEDSSISTHVTSGEEEEATPSRPAAVVLPLTRQAKGDGADSRAAVATNLQRLLRLAANRGAATVYVVANTAPLVRVDGEFSTLEGEPAISTAIVERLLAEVSPAGREAAPPSAEWLIDVPEIGRVRCLTFRDHRGPGVIFRMVPPRAIAADQLGLSAEVQALCSEADGLVLVTGGRDSGRSTLLTSFVDLINRTRADHIITLESQIDFVHESKRSFISQREVRGEDAMGGSLRSACREEPDVLVIEDIRSHDVAALALEAAEMGRLVFASVPGLSTASAIERLIELFPTDRREKAQAALAGSLRGVVSQVLLRKLRGGRIAAREVLLNTPAVAGLILEGKTFQLSAAIENGRRAGMVSFAESLAALVREGVVHPAHAYRKAPSREQLIAALHRDGVDTAIAERLG
jgi:twitching motility protein PilT